MNYLVFEKCPLTMYLYIYVSAKPAVGILAKPLKHIVRPTINKLSTLSSSDIVLLLHFKPRVSLALSSQPPDCLCSLAGWRG